MSADALTTNPAIRGVHTWFVTFAGRFTAPKPPARDGVVASADGVPIRSVPGQ